MTLSDFIPHYNRPDSCAVEPNVSHYNFDTVLEAHQVRVKKHI